MMPLFSFQDLRRCLGNQLGRDAGSFHGRERLVEDLGIDSLAMHALLLDIEEQGGLIPSPQRMEKVTTVVELYSAVATEPLL